MFQLSKTVVYNSPVLNVIEDNIERHFRLHSKCNVVTTRGRVLVGVLSYIGDVHLELDTDRGKLLVMYSSIDDIEEWKKER